MRAAESRLSDVAALEGHCALGLWEVFQAPHRLLQENPLPYKRLLHKQLAVLHGRENPGEEPDSHQRTQKEPYEALNKPQHLATPERDVEEDAEFVSVVKFAPF